MNIEINDVLHEIGQRIALMKQSTNIILSSTRGEIIDKSAIDYHAGLLAVTALSCEFWLLVAETGGRLSQSNAPVQINFHNEFTRCIAAFRKIANREHIKFELRSERGAVNFISAHPAVSQVPYILLDNAAKYASSYEKVEILIKETDEGIIINTSNTGPFVSRQELNNILNSGGRGYQALKSGVPGSGLGLLVLVKIVAAARGSVEIDCDPLGIEINGVEQGCFQVETIFPKY